MPKSVKPLGNNKFKLTVSCGYDESGKQKTRSKTVTCKRGESEAYEMLGQFKIELQNQTVVAKKKEQTLGSFIREKWLPNYAMLACDSPASYDSYYQITKRITLALGHISLGKIKREHISKFIYALRHSKSKNSKKPLSYITIRRHQDILKSILAKAVEWGDLSSNPAEKLPRVKVPKKEKNIPNDDEMSALLKVLEKEPLWRKAMFYVLLNTGIRRGELIAIQWKDVDLQNKNISITATLVKSSRNGIVRKNPKTESGKRNINISDECCELLKQLRQEQLKLKPLLMEQSNYNAGIFDYVFFNPETCSPYHPDTVSHLLPKLCEKAGIKNYAPHAIRHWVCSGLLDAKIPVKHVQQLMGHSDASTTLNVYTHIMKSSTINTADAVSSKLSMLKGNE